MTLREARYKLEVPQIELHLRTGISQTKLSHIERGHCVPRSEECEKIAQALGLKVNDIEWNILPLSTRLRRTNS